MTVPAGWADESGQQYAEDVEEQYEIGVVPVKIMYTENENLAPAYATMMTWTLPVVGINSPIMILQKRLKRYKAKFLLNFPGAGSAYTNTKFEPLTLATPQGFTISAAGILQNIPLPEYEAMTPLWAIASIPGVTLSVVDEAYGITQ